MIKIAMNCGYCGKKCDMKKDLCVPQDSVYVCKTCYDWSQKIADLEAKLAQTREFLKIAYEDIDELQNENDKLEQQLEEQPKQIVEKISKNIAVDNIKCKLYCRYDDIKNILDNILKEYSDEN